MSSHLEPIVLPKNIGDKLFERRKSAALELEQLIRRLTAAGDQQRITQTLDKLISEYAVSCNSNYRKGALLCLAAAVVGLGKPTEAHLQQIVPPMLASFTDQDGRVRYYACEALYNVAKVARETFICVFTDVFDALFRLCADADKSVRNAIPYLNDLVKDIVTGEPEAFNLDSFVPKLVDCLRAVHPDQRQFLVSWITVLYSVPDLDMLHYLPQLLDGLMAMLSDSNREIRVAAHKALMEFLIEIHATHTVDFGSMATLLVDKSRTCTDEFTRLTALKWLKEFVEMAARQLVGHYPLILGAVLSNISHPDGEIRQVAQDTNNALLKLKPDKRVDASQWVDSSAILAVITYELRSEQEPTRLEALRWIHFLLLSSQAQMLQQLHVLLPALHDALQASSEPVVLQAISILATLADCPQQFQPVIVSLIERFRGVAGEQVLRRRGALVLRRMCFHLGAQRVFSELASLLVNEADLPFASTVVQALNLVLLTSAEAQSLRDLLRSARTTPEGAAFFVTLYPCWSHSVGALLSLCFLSQAYSHAGSIVLKLATLPIGVEALVQIDRLVQLLEMPCFTSLRLQLVAVSPEDRSHVHDLLRALYALLALLPQSDAFRTLSTRLQSVPTLALLRLDQSDASTSATTAEATSDSSGTAGGDSGTSSTSTSGSSWADFGSLLAAFEAHFRKHAAIEGARQQSISTPAGAAGHTSVSFVSTHQPSGVTHSSPSRTGVSGGIMAAALGHDVGPMPPSRRVSQDPASALASLEAQQRGRSNLAPDRHTPR